MSDHSSHFDSVLGTAINLGIHSVNEKGSLHYPKVSALAREAKELQGVRSPSSNSVKKDDDKGEFGLMLDWSENNLNCLECLRKGSLITID